METPGPEVVHLDDEWSYRLDEFEDGGGDAVALFKAALT